MQVVGVLLLCVFAFIDVTLCNTNKERKLVEILEHVRAIREHITKEDRLREIADIVRIDSNVDKLSDKLDRVLDILDNRSPAASGRSDDDTNAMAPQDLRSGMGIIQSRLEALEVAVGSVEDTMKKMDFDPVKVNEIERRTTQLKDDMNAKLRKMMNVLTALYELNKEMRVNAESRSETTDPQPKGDGESSPNFAIEYLTENLEELQRKIKEQFSILTSEMRSEVTSLKIMATSASANCQTPPADDEEEEDEWMKPQDTNNARSNRNSNRQAGRSLATESTLDSLVETLGRSTREIREEIQQGMVGIDNKLQNLTVLAQSQPKCDSLQASESIVSSRRIVMPPSQSLDESVRREKTACSKTVQNVPNPKSCADLRKGGATCDGIYVIFPKGRRAVRVYCDMNTDGGGWSLIMRRGDYGNKMTSFNRNWLSYKNGFGDTEGEFWLGNDVINFMTSEDGNVLRIHMSAFDSEEINLDFSSFAVGNESSNYSLYLGSPVGAGNIAANGLMYHNNHPFSTFDRKNDGFEQNCAATYKGGWWFNGCYFGFLTGEYFKSDDKRENWQGMLWYDWKGNSPLKAAEMMIRPQNFTSRL